MRPLRLSPKSALVIFLTLVGFALAMATWWIILMAQLTDEKVDLAAELGAAAEHVERLHQQEIERQILLGTEGVVFLVLTLLGVWLIYRSLVQTERLRRLQENFLMAVTHELKTPLASLVIYLDTLQSEKIPGEKKQQLIPRMKEDLRRLESLVEDILEAGRIEASAYQPERLRLDLGVLLTDVIKEVSASRPGKQLRLTRHIDSDICILADRLAIGRAVRAILDNAIKYSGEGTVDLTVSLRRRGRLAETRITDQGLGIDKGELPLIFDRFYRVGHELTRACPGTGLGLYLCRQMVRAHGGEVTARSEGIGHGTEFTISLPLDESQ